MKNLFRNIFLVSCLLLTVGAVEAQAQTAQKASLEQLKAKYEQLAPGSPESKEAKAQYKKALMEQQNALPDGSVRNKQGDVEHSSGIKTNRMEVTAGPLQRTSTLQETKQVSNDNLEKQNPQKFAYKKSQEKVTEPTSAQQKQANIARVEKTLKETKGNEQETKHLEQVLSNLKNK